MLRNLDGSSNSSRSLSDRVIPFAEVRVCVFLRELEYLRQEEGNFMHLIERPWMSFDFVPFSFSGRPSGSKVTFVSWVQILSVSRQPRHLYLLLHRH